MTLQENAIAIGLSTDAKTSCACSLQRLKGNDCSTRGITFTFPIKMARLGGFISLIRLFLIREETSVLSVAFKRTILAISGDL